MLRHWLNGEVFASTAACIPPSPLASQTLTRIYSPRELQLWVDLSRVWARILQLYPLEDAREVFLGRHVGLETAFKRVARM